MKKQSVLRQVLGMLGTHLIVCLLFMFVVVGVVSVAENNTVVQNITAVVAAVAYALFMFTSSYEYAIADHKSYSKLKPYPIKGAVLALGIVTVIVGAWIFYGISWIVAPQTEDILVLSTAAANLIYSYVTAPFWIMVKITGAAANLPGQLASIAIPVAACAVGYYCGYRKWDYVKYLNRFVFEKKKK